MTDLFEPAAFRSALQAWLDDNDLTPRLETTLSMRTRRSICAC